LVFSEKLVNPVLGAILLMRLHRVIVCIKSYTYLGMSVFKNIRNSVEIAIKKGAYNAPFLIRLES
jgi:hypothetical protein